MFTDEFKKACEACKSEEELKTVIESHKSELTDEELQQISGGWQIIYGAGIRFTLGTIANQMENSDLGFWSPI